MVARISVDLAPVRGTLASGEGGVASTLGDDSDVEDLEAVCCLLQATNRAQPSSARRNIGCARRQAEPGSSREPVVRRTRDRASGSLIRAIAVFGIVPGIVRTRGIELGRPDVLPGKLGGEPARNLDRGASTGQRAESGDAANDVGLRLCEAAAGVPLGDAFVRLIADVVEVVAGHVFVGFPQQDPGRTQVAEAKFRRLDFRRLRLISDDRAVERVAGDFDGALLELYFFRPTRRSLSSFGHIST